MNLSPANLGILTIQYEREFFPMKKTFRILAVVLAATMLMCCCAMATSKEIGETRSRSYGCSCGPYNSSAYIETDTYQSSISCSFSGWVQWYSGGTVNIGDSHYNTGTWARCQEDYIHSVKGAISASFAADGFADTDGDSFGF